jgi:hypothetical protein
VNAFSYIAEQGNKLSKTVILGLEKALSNIDTRWNASSALEKAANQKQELPDTTLEALAKLLDDTTSPLQVRKNSSSVLLYSAQKSIKLSSDVLFILKETALDKDSVIQNNSINTLSFALKDSYKIDQKTILNIENLLSKKDLIESISSLLVIISSQKYDLSETIVSDLTKILDDKSYNIAVHIKAVATLKNVARNSQILDFKAISVLKKKLTNNNPEIKHNSVYALAYCTKYSPEILDILEQHLLDKDVSLGASYAFRKYVKRNSDISSAIVEKLTKLLLPDYGSTARNNAICTLRNLAACNYVLPKITIKALENAITDESLYMKNNAICTLGYAAHNGHYIASEKIVELLEEALSNTATHDTSRFTLKYIKNDDVIINDKKRILPNSSSSIYQHLKAPTGNIKIELQKTIVQEDNKIAHTKEKALEQNLTLTSLEEALAGKSGNTEQGQMAEILPSKILEGDHKAWYRQTSAEIDNLLKLAKNQMLLTEIDLKYLSNKILGIGWCLYAPIRGIWINNIALALKYAAENGQILPGEGINSLAAALIGKTNRGLGFFLKRNSEEFKKMPLLLYAMLLVTGKNCLLKP